MQTLYDVYYDEVPKEGLIISTEETVSINYLGERKIAASFQGLLWGSAFESLLLTRERLELKLKSGHPGTETKEQEGIK